jgi:hypothetical protein
MMKWLLNLNFFDFFPVTVKFNVFISFERKKKERMRAITEEERKENGKEVRKRKKGERREKEEKDKRK